MPIIQKPKNPNDIFFTSKFSHTLNPKLHHEVVLLHAHVIRRFSIIHPYPLQYGLSARLTLACRGQDLCFFIPWHCDHMFFTPMSECLWESNNGLFNYNTFPSLPYKFGKFSSNIDLWKLSNPTSYIGGTLWPLLRLWCHSLRYTTLSLYKHVAPTILQTFMSSLQATLALFKYFTHDSKIHWHYLLSTHFGLGPNNTISS